MEEEIIELPGIDFLEENLFQQQEQEAEKEKKRKRKTTRDEIVLPLQKIPRIETDKGKAEERRKILHLLRLYEINFPEVINHSKYNDELEHLKNEELQSILNDARFKISQHNSLSFSKSALELGCQLTEGICERFTPIQAKGFSFAMCSNPSVESCLKEIYIESTFFQNYIPPQNRLLFIGLTTLLSIHNLNLSRDKTEEELSKYIEDEWKDL